MCQYRYYYYAGCRHQRTVLSNYCAHANSTAIALAAQQRDPGAPVNPEELEEDGEESASAHDEAASASSRPALSTRDSGTTTLSSCPDTPPDSDIAHHTSASIPELNSDVTSLHRPHSGTCSRRRTVVAIDDMAADVGTSSTKPSWGQPHQRMTGAPNTDLSWAVVDRKENIVHKTHAPSQTQTQTRLAHQQNDQSHHFAEHTWHAASTQPSDHGFPQDRKVLDLGREFADMQAQLEVAHEELARLHAEEAQRQRAIDTAASVDESGPSGPYCHSGASPAALLLREHEKATLQQSCRSDVPMHDIPQPLHSSLEFPGLLDVHCTQSKTPEGPSTTPRKPSYANMATHGMLNAIGQNFPSSTGSSRGPNTSNDSTHAHTGCSCATSHTSTDVTTDAEVGEDNAVVSPQSPDDCSSGLDPVSTLKSHRATKFSPRFAQPTVAFTRRADETIRKDSFFSAGKTGSMKKPSTMCSTLQKQQKRKSLPGDWFGQSSESACPSAQTSSENHSVEHINGSHGCQEPTLRKKTSTYMSPTKAATRRTIATIGHDTATPSPPRLPRNFTKLALHTDMTSCSSISKTSSPTSPETAIETENVALRELQIRPRMGEKLDLSRPRRLPFNGALPRPQQLRPNTFASDLLAAQAKAAGLPMPANTTAQRRGSHGHLLIPIKAKLDKIGILRENPQPANVRRGSELLSPISQSSESELFSPLTRSIFAAQATALPEIQHMSQHTEAPQNPKKAVPPHVRAAIRDATAAAEAVGATYAPSLRATAQEFRPMFDHAPALQLDLAPQHAHMADRAITQPLLEPKQHGLDELPFQLPPGISFPQAQLQEPNSLVPQSQGSESVFNRLPRTSLPRSFTTATASMPFVTDEDAKKFYDEEEWSSLTSYDRKRILERREALRYQDQARSQPFSGCPETLIAQPIALQGGHVLLPRFDPITKVVSWTLDNKDPISLGSLLPTDPQFAADHVQQTPSFRVPRTPALVPRSWTVGTEQARQVFGWKGGDGREIKFVGHGPDAEREPHHGVRFKYQRRMTSMGRGPRMIGDDVEDGSPEAPLAPRGRRQWAQLAGSPQQACDRMDIVDAVEQIPIPFGPALHGFCDDCAVNSH